VEVCKEIYRGRSVQANQENAMDQSIIGEKDMPDELEQAGAMEIDSWR
jgi:hypothetical protein